MRAGLLTPFVQEQHRPRPSGRDRLGYNQPIIHHRPSHHPRLIRTRLVWTPLRQILPHRRPRIRTGTFRSLPMSDRRVSSLAPRPQIYPRVRFLPLFDRMPQYRDWGHAARRRKNDSFWWDAGI